MKNKFCFILTLLLGFISFVGCQDDEDISLGLNISSAQHNVSMLGDIFEIVLEVPGPWVTKSNNWLKVSPENGAAGKHTVRIAADAASGSDFEIQGSVEFLMADGSESKIISVNRVEPTPGRLSDSLALVAFYNATGGDRWSVQWNFNLPMDKWQEILLEEIDGEMRVTKVMPKSFGLKGELPECLKYLDQLRWFSVEDNQMSGEIPDFMYDFKYLENLILGKNNFSGTLSSKLFELPLIYLVLNDNNFSGNLPENIGDCSTLKTLWLNGNNFEGQIPASFGNLKNMEFLMMQQNHFSGTLPDFSQMDSIRIIEMSRNGVFENITDTKPDGHTVAKYRYVSDGFSGAAPKFVNKPNLQYVWLFENNLNESPSFENCPKVEQIRLDLNPIKELHSSVVNNMESLLELHLAHCELSSLPEFVNCPKLKFVVASSNNLQSVPESLCDLKALEELMLYDNQINSLPEDWSDLVLMRHINMAYNKLTFLPESIWNLPIYSLAVQCNEISNALPTSLAGATNLMNVNLNMNKFSGPVDPLTTLFRASEIHASRNAFTGEIPEGFGLLASLTILTLDANQLTGTIPSDLVKCKALGTFHLYDNNLSGVVPSSIVQIWEKWDPEENILKGNELTVQ